MTTVILEIKEDRILAHRLVNDQLINYNADGSVKTVDFNGLVVDKKVLVDVNDLNTGLYSIVFQQRMLSR